MNYKLNYELELDYCTLDKEQITQFSYNITKEFISNYILEHQKEVEKWKEEEYIKDLIRLAINKPKQKVGVKERIKLLNELKSKDLLKDCFDLNEIKLRMKKIQERSLEQVNVELIINNIMKQLLLIKQFTPNINTSSSNFKK